MEKCTCWIYGVVYIFYFVNDGYVVLYANGALHMLHMWCYVHMILCTCWICSAMYMCYSVHVAHVMLCTHGMVCIHVQVVLCI